LSRGLGDVYKRQEYMFNADAAKPEEIEAFGVQLVEKIDDPKRSNPRQYLYDSMTQELEDVYEDLGLA
ncbi:hypothetical protein, partial [Vibrio harveyi]|uniref:hypothetical protein n=1 Tax=Vibrio harveyi TaxID=669 RepID=UPI001A7EC2D8